MHAHSLRRLLLVPACLILLSNVAKAIDFFDALPLDEFWKQENVTVSTESMTGYLVETKVADVSGLIKQLGAAKFVEREKAFQALKQSGGAVLPQLEKAAKESTDVEIRTRLGQLIEAINRRNASLATSQMAAIRTITARNMKDALPALRKAVDNKNPLVADYAKQAIAKFEEKPYHRAEVSAEALAQDLALLPYDCGIVAQARGANLKVGEIYSRLKGLPFGGASGLDRMKREIVGAARMLGNVRIDSATMGVSDDIGGRGGYAVFVFRGKYSKDAFVALTRDESRVKEPAKLNGIEVWQPDNEVAIIFPSDDRLVLVVGDRERYLPLGRVTKALATKSSKIALNASMRELMSKVDRTKQAWAVAKTNSNLRAELALLRPFDWFTGEAYQDADGSLHFSFTGYGPDNTAIAEMLATTRGYIDTAIGELDKKAAEVPLMKSMVVTMKSLKLENKGNRAQFTATVDEATTLVFSPMLLFTVGRSARVEAIRAREKAAVEEKVREIKKAEEAIKKAEGDRKEAIKDAKEAHDEARKAVERARESAREAVEKARDAASEQR